MIAPRLSSVIAAVFFLSFPPVVTAEEDEIRSLVAALPGKLEALYEENEEGFAGSTLAMSEASYAIGDSLLPDLVKLVAASGELTLDEAEKAKAEIERDARGGASDVYFSNHATGWGGTITKIEAAAAFSTHIETRICYEVTRLFEDDEDFDLEGWHERWAKAGGSTGSTYADPAGEEEEYEPGIHVDEGQVKFDRGASGGILELGREEVVGGSVTFYAKAGQRIVLAATGCDIRLDRETTAGRYAAVGDWCRAIEATLPESKGGLYRVRFGDAGKGGAKLRLLMEIR